MAADQHTTLEDQIAIVGMAGRFPGASAIDGLWARLLTGDDILRPRRVGPQTQMGGHWIETDCLVADPDRFDAAFFGISPREAELLDPQHRLFMETAWSAAEDAGLVLGEARQPVGVFGGANFTSYFWVPESSYLLQALPGLLGVDKDYLATRVAHKLALSGPAVTVQSACSTSLVAVHLACHALIAGDCDAAIAGGVSLTQPRNARHLYLPGGMLSADGYCRPFDAAANGTVFSEGVVALALKRLPEAIAEGDHIYAVIVGSALNNDGAPGASYSAPSIGGQSEVLARAYQVAGLKASQVEFVEAHGTGTVLGDAVELTALSRLFEAHGAAPGSCLLGSIKSNIGHLASAAGAAGLVKAALSLRHEVVPPTLNFEHPNPDFDPRSSPFRVNTAPVAWPRCDRPRHAGVSSFGIGGTNAHVVLREAPPDDRPDTASVAEILVLSTRTETALAAALEGMQGRLAADPNLSLQRVAHTTQSGRRAFPIRAALVARSVEEATALLDRPGGVVTASAETRPRVCFLFPGQGAQYAGMGRDLHDRDPMFRRALDAAFDAMSDDVRAAVEPFVLAYPDGEREPLVDTALVQPALFAVEYALAQLLQSWGLEPDIALGHSLGEYVAACVAGVWDLGAAVRLVEERARAMSALPPGAMASVAADPEAVLARLDGSLSFAAFNAPRQTVVSGSAADISRFEERLVGEGLKVQRLRTSHAFHNALMRPAAATLVRNLPERAVEPRFPIVSNVTGELWIGREGADAGYWGRHLLQPVQFAAGVKTVADLGRTVFVEVGPGRALTALTKASAPESAAVTAMTARSPGEEAVAARRAAAFAWTHGAPIDWAGVRGGRAASKVSLPSYPFERTPVPMRPHVAGEDARREDSRADPSEWVYRISWRRLDPPAGRDERASPSCGLTLLIADPRGIAHALADWLRERGARCVLAAIDEAAGAGGDEGRVDFVAPSEEALIDALQANGLSPERVVHLGSLRTAPCDEPFAREWAVAKEQGFRSLQRLREALRARPAAEAREVIAVTHGALDVVGDEGLCPSHASLVAFNHVTPQECPELKCGLIDVCLDRPVVELAEQIGRELLHRRGARTVALRNGFGWAPAYEPAPAEEWRASSPPALGGTYLIVGGLGRIGLEIAEALTEDGAAQVVLTTRRRIPDIAEWDRVALDLEHPLRLTIERLAAMAAQTRLRVAQLDPQDVAGLRKLRAELETEDADLRGIVYAAGDLGLAQHAGAAEVERHAEAKAGGVDALIQAFGDAKVRFCIVLSSISTVLGGLGHEPYAAANSMADLLVARFRRRTHAPWSCLKFDLWNFGDDVGPQLRRLYRLAILPQEGRTLLRSLWESSAGRDLVISTHDLQKRIGEWVELRAQPEAPGGSSAESRRRTRQRGARVELEQATAIVAEAWREALGEPAGLDDDFFALGGHSLVAIQIIAQLTAELGVEIAPEALFDHPTVRGMAEFVVAAVSAAAPDAVG